MKIFLSVWPEANKDVFNGFQDNPYPSLACPTNFPMFYFIVIKLISPLAAETAIKSVFPWQCLALLIYPL